MPGNDANLAGHAEAGDTVANTMPPPILPSPSGKANDQIFTVPPAHQAPSDETSVGPLLARAHLLRLRGQWDEAVTACTEALRRLPNSPTACSLLGDIYEAQGKSDVAMHWYGMAVEFNPESKVDRAKLDRVVGTQRRALVAEEREAQARALHAPGKRADPAHRTLQWFDRLFPPGQQESIARLILVAGVVLFLLLVSTAAFVYFGSSNTGAGAVVALTEPPMTIDPVVVQPAPPTPPAPKAPSTQRTVAPPPPAPPLVSPAPFGNPALRNQVAYALPSEVQVTGAQTNPSLGQIELTIIVPATPESPAQTRTRILRLAAAALRAAALAAPAMERASIRVFLGPAAGNGAVSAVSGQLAFVGDTATVAVRAVAPPSGDAPLPGAAPGIDLSSLFTNPWWSPTLDPNSTSP